MLESEYFSGIVVSMKNRYVFGRLFARPSFAEGAGRLVDLGATMQQYNTSKTEMEADITALQNDWYAVGNDFQISIKQYEQESVTSK